MGSTCAMKAESMWTCAIAVAITSSVAAGLVSWCSKPPSIPVPPALDVTAFPVAIISSNATGYKPTIKLSWKWSDNDGREVKDWPKYRGFHRVEFAIESRSDATHWTWTQVGRVMSNSFTINNRLPQEQFRVKTMTNSLPWVYTR